MRVKSEDLKVFQKDCYQGELPVKTLYKGDSGDQVQLLQEFLNWYGDYGLKIDGKYGEATEKAVKDFQATTGYYENGVFDAIMRYVASYKHRKQKV